MTNVSAGHQQHQNDGSNLHLGTEEAIVISDEIKEHISTIEDLDAEDLLASLYYDAGTMSSLNPTAEVRHFRPCQVLFASLAI